MNFQFYLEKLKHSEEYKEFLKENPEAYPCSGFFTIDKEAFFEDQDVESGVDRNIVQSYESNHRCSIGVDYGAVSAATVISVVAETKQGVRLIFQYAKPGLDLNLLSDKNWEHSFQNLKKRYPNTVHIVTDDCAAGMQTNQWLENEGYPLHRFNFRSDQSLGDRNRGYYMFRGKLKLGKIKYPEIRELLSEMKSLQEIKMDVNLRIKAPRNYSDDRIDSLMIACYPFLIDDNTFKSSLVDYSEVIKEKQKKYPFGRVDPEWEKIKLNGDM